MNKSTKDAVYYVCALIEQIGRTTKNRRADVIGYFSEKDIERQLKLADINHCLPIEQVSGELIEDYMIQEGSFDTVGGMQVSGTVSSFDRPRLPETCYESGRKQSCQSCERRILIIHQ